MNADKRKWSDRPKILNILLPLLILGPIIYFVFTPQFNNHPWEAKFTFARADLSNLRSALDAFAADNARYPTATEGFDALLQNPGLSTWKGPYIKKIPNDPWGNPYQYVPQAPAISSAGPDQRFNTSDDITNP